MDSETDSNTNNTKRNYYIRKSNRNNSNYIQSFEKDILNDQINSKLIALFEAEILEVFPNILNISKNEFINLIESRIKTSISEQYPNDNIEIIFKNNKFNKIFNNNMQILHEKYSLYMKELTEAWENYSIRLSIKKVKKEDLFFTDFRKHCIKTGEYALHKCSKNKYGEYLSVLHKSSVDDTLSVRYLICKKCKKSYFTSLFLNYCKECDESYYSNKLMKKEKVELQLATYNPSHCKSLFNKKIKCPKCINNNLYLNLTTNKLCCLNKKCNFLCNPDNSKWECDMCNATFRTNIKLFNPLEIQNVKDAIKLSLLIKKKAHPIRMICCNDINVYNSVFYHNKKCNGILYLGELDKNSIIICQKCKAINYFTNFIWTCPSCGKRFKENPDNYKKIKKKIDNKNIENTENIGSRSNKKEKEKIKENNIKNTNEIKKEPLRFNKRSEKIIHISNNSNNKNIKKTEKNFDEEKGTIKNYMFNRLRNGETGRKSVANNNSNNYNNNIKKTSELRNSIPINNNSINNSDNNVNNKKRYILSKYLEMQITQSNSKPKNDQKKKIEIENNCYSSEKLNHRLYYKNKNKFFNRSALNEDVKNNREEKQKNSVLNNIRKENIIIKEKNPMSENSRYSSNTITDHDKDKDINNNNKKLFSENRNYYHNKYKFKNRYSNESSLNEKSIEKFNKINHIIFNDRKDDISRRTDSNGYFSKNNSKSGVKRFISNDLKEEIIPYHNNLLLHKSQNLFNVRQKYINRRNKKINPQVLSQNNINNNSMKEKMVGIVKYQENSANFERNANYKNRLMYRKMLGLFNSTSKDKDINNKDNSKRNLMKDLEKEQQKSERVIYKYKIKEYNDHNNKKNKVVVNDEPLITDPNNSVNEKSKESTREYNKNSNQKSDISIEITPKENQIRKLSKKISDNVDISKDDTNKDELKDYKDINDNSNNNNINNNMKYEDLDDLDLLEREKELQEKEELLKEILANLEREEELRNRPNDIMDISNLLNDSNFSIPVLSKSINENEKLYEEIQNKIKTMLSKGKLPLFNIKNYIIKKQIGDGSYGFIYQVVQKDTRKEYAIKKIISSDISTLKDFQTEFEIVHQNPHKYILNLYGICINIIDSDNFILYVLMDLADCDWEMEINEYLINHKFYTEEQLLLILKQLTSALTFLEKEKNIAHRDIKPENVLVFRSNSNDKEDIYKIADFGEAKEAKISKQLNTLRGTELYMSPLLYSGLQQKLDDVKHDPYKSDVFSLGYCLIYAAAMNFNVIYDIRNLENKYMIKKVLKKYFNRRYSDKFIELILKMISFNESERVDFVQLEDILKKEF